MSPLEPNAPKKNKKIVVPHEDCPVMDIRSIIIKHQQLPTGYQKSPLRGLIRTINRRFRNINHLAKSATKHNHQISLYTNIMQ